MKVPSLFTGKESTSLPALLTSIANSVPPALVPVPLIVLSARPLASSYTMPFTPSEVTELEMPSDKSVYVAVGSGPTRTA